MQLRSFDSADATREPRQRLVNRIGLRADARPGPLGATWDDWLLIGQVASVVLVCIWLVLVGYVTFGGVSPGQ